MVLVRVERFSVPERGWAVMVIRYLGCFDTASIYAFVSMTFPAVKSYENAGVGFRCRRL